MTVVHVMKLPNGISLTAEDDLSLHRKWLEHAAASMAEGMCPYHAVQLTPASVTSGTGGHCVPCGAWLRYDQHAEPYQFDWALSHHPDTGELCRHPPAWLRGIPEEVDHG